MPKPARANVEGSGTGGGIIEALMFTTKVAGVSPGAVRYTRGSSGKLTWKKWFPTEAWLVPSVTARRSVACALSVPRKKPLAHPVSSVRPEAGPSKESSVIFSLTVNEGKVNRSGFDAGAVLCVTMGMTMAPAPTKC
jgi:hypothetical protein